MTTFWFFVIGWFLGFGLMGAIWLSRTCKREPVTIPEKEYSVIKTSAGYRICRSSDVYFLDGNEKTVILRAIDMDNETFTTCDPEIFDFDDLQDAQKFVEVHDA